MKYYNDSIPKAFIKKITLEEKSSLEAGQRNPHIVAPETPAAQYEFVSSWLSNANLSSTLEFEIKVDLENNALSALVSSTALGAIRGKDELLDFLAIDVYQLSHDGTIHAAMSLMNNAPHNLHIYLEDLVNQDNENVTKHTISLYEAGGHLWGHHGNVGTSVDYLNPGYARGIDLDENLFKKKENGKTVYRLPYTLTFSLGNSNPSDLAYFIVPHINETKIEGILDGFFLSIDSSGMSQIIQENFYGQVAAEVVIQQGQTKTTTGVLTLPLQGGIWSGPHHQMANGQYMTGAEHTNESQTLKVRQAINTKIQDLRKLKQISHHEFNLNAHPDLWKKNLIKTKFFNASEEVISEEADKKHNVFSDLHMSADSAGQCRGFFAINFQKIIEENSIFPEFYNRLRSMWHLPSGVFSSYGLLSSIEKCRIISFKLNRKRIKEEYGVPFFGTRQVVDFDKNIPKKTIAYTTQYPEEKHISYIDKTFIKLRETEIPISQSSALGYTGQTWPNLRFFEFLDSEIAAINAGVYQYDVELEIEDVLPKILQLMLQGLKEDRMAVHRYHIEAQGSDSNTQEKYYNSISKRFTQTFIDTYRYSGTKASPSGPGHIFLKNTQAALSRYMIVAQALDLFKTSTEAQTVRPTLAAMISPRTGSPQGILKFVELLDNIIFEIERILGGTKSTDPHAKNSQQSSISYSSKGVINRTFKIKYEFRDGRLQQLFDTQGDLKRKGYEFIFPQEDFSKITNTISHTDYLARADTEKNQYTNEIKPTGTADPKFAELLDQTAIGQNYVSYMSPIRVDVATKSVFLHIVKNIDFYNKLYIDILRSNSEEGQGGFYRAGWSNSMGVDSNLSDLSSEEKDIIIQLGALIAGRSCIIKPPPSQEELMHNPGGESGIAGNEVTKKSNSLINQSLFSTKKNYTNILMGLVKPVGAHTQKSPSVLALPLASIADDVPFATFALNKQQSLFTGDILQIPSSVAVQAYGAQSAALGPTAMVATSATGIDLTRNNFSFLWFKLYNIMEVQFLQGFKVGDDGIPNLKSPIWKTIKTGDMNNTNLKFCKLKPYNWNDTPFLEKTSFSELKLPVYNKYFYIASTDYAALQGPQYQQITEATTSPALEQIQNFNNATTWVDETSTTLIEPFTPPSHGPVVLHNQSTEGSEFEIQGTGRVYQGPWHMHTDGTFMTGKFHIPGLTHNVLIPLPGSVWYFASSELSEGGLPSETGY